MIERKPGWYWVKDGEGWKCAEWRESAWHVGWAKYATSDYPFDEVGPRIPTPDEPWQCVPVEATRAQESDAEDYWQSKRFAAFSDDPRTWAGVYQAMIKAAPKP